MRATLDPRLDSLTEKTIGAAFAVANTFGHGFLEAVYQNALVEELRASGLAVAKEKQFVLTYRGKQVGFYIADIVVEDSVIVEMKAVERLTRAHGAQVLNYLKAAQLGVGLLFNFGLPSIEIKRIVNRSYFGETQVKRMKEDANG